VIGALLPDLLVQLVCHDVGTNANDYKQYDYTSANHLNPIHAVLQHCAAPISALGNAPPRTRTWHEYILHSLHLLVLAVLTRDLLTL
jgi:hypothetical protein